MRLVGFNPSQQKVMKEFMDAKSPIQLSDCQLKEARRGNQMEVLLKGSTKLNASPRKFAIPPLQFEDDNPKEISLDHLAPIDVFERVTAMGKSANLYRGY